MSRSFRKCPVVNYHGFRSNKESKRIANRATRRANKQILRTSNSYIKDEEYSIDNPVEVIVYWPVENLGNSDFKNVKEIMDVYDFQSDGLPCVISKEAKIWDWSKPYVEKHWYDHPTTTITEAKQQHNWQTLKHYISK